MAFTPYTMAPDPSPRGLPAEPSLMLSRHSLHHRNTLAAARSMPTAHTRESQAEVGVCAGQREKATACRCRIVDIWSHRHTCRLQANRDRQASIDGGGAVAGEDLHVQPRRRRDLRQTSASREAGKCARRMRLGLPRNLQMQHIRTVSHWRMPLRSAMQPGPLCPDLLSRVAGLGMIVHWQRVDEAYGKVRHCTTQHACEGPSKHPRHGCIEQHGHGVYARMRWFPGASNDQMRSKCTVSS